MVAQSSPASGKLSCAPSCSSWCVGSKWPMWLLREHWQVPGKRNKARGKGDGFFADFNLYDFVSLQIRLTGKYFPFITLILLCICSPFPLFSPFPQCSTENGSVDPWGVFTQMAMLIMSVLPFALFLLLILTTS